MDSDLQMITYKQVHSDILAVQNALGEIASHKILDIKRRLFRDACETESLDVLKRIISELRIPENILIYHIHTLEMLKMCIEEFGVKMTSKELLQNAFEYDDIEAFDFVTKKYCHKCKGVKMVNAVITKEDFESHDKVKSNDNMIDVTDLALPFCYKLTKLYQGIIDWGFSMQTKLIRCCINDVNDLTLLGTIIDKHKLKFDKRMMDAFACDEKKLEFLMQKFNMSPKQLADGNLVSPKAMLDAGKFKIFEPILDAMIDTASVRKANRKGKALFKLVFGTCRVGTVSQFKRIEKYIDGNQELITLALESACYNPNVDVFKYIATIYGFQDITLIDALTSCNFEVVKFIDGIQTIELQKITESKKRLYFNLLEPKLLHYVCLNSLNLFKYFVDKFGQDMEKHIATWGATLVMHYARNNNLDGVVYSSEIRKFRPTLYNPDLLNELFSCTLEIVKYVLDAYKIDPKFIRETVTECKRLYSYNTDVLFYLTKTYFG
jgi:hypothetical protein